MLENDGTVEPWKEKQRITIGNSGQHQKERPSIDGVSESRGWVLPEGHATGDKGASVTKDARRMI